MECAPHLAAIQGYKVHFDAILGHPVHEQVAGSSAQEQRRQGHVQRVLNNNSVLIGSSKVMQPCRAQRTPIRDKGDLEQVEQRNMSTTVQVRAQIGYCSIKDLPGAMLIFLFHPSRAAL